MTPSIVLDMRDTRPNGTRQGCASPRSSTAPWTEPVRPREETLYEGDDRLTLNDLQPRFAYILVDRFGGQVNSYGGMIYPEGEGIIVQVYEMLRPGGAWTFLAYVLDRDLSVRDVRFDQLLPAEYQAAREGNAAIPALDEAQLDRLRTGVHQPSSSADRSLAN